MAQVCASLICTAAFGQTADSSLKDKEWNSTKSNYFVIYYRPTADLQNIAIRLKKRVLYFEQTPQGEKSAEQQICRRMDALFNRVKDILGMYPDVPRINIKIFKDRPELDEEYFNIFKARKYSRSFYINSFNTIYTSENDIDDSVMIHEMAHVIMDHYFATNLPEKASEILASYVDMHLEK